ncbi:DUF499 domain-containing protein [Halosegnis marinus]|uniref:DUF499 domain-containing protein n=1 Tax=Halosegnis marinus TaxID=3034023 RepID=A0ABD5ZT82_9EURY|nr:DUF499 domain-containing protein [Halosegnis sp. DT85]
MVALYHCFAAPRVAGEWAADKGNVDGLQAALPEDATAITVAMQYENNDYDYLWEPFFEGLDADPGDFDTGGYPDIKTIQEAVGDRTVAFIIDELEDWFDTLDKDLESANRGFLQALMEATAIESLDLFTIASVLRRGSKVHDILNREDAVQVNMDSKVSKEDVLLHRLIDGVEEGPASDIIDGYLEAYHRSDYVDDEAVTRDEMLELYPFHPALIETLESRYYAGDENQNTRGMIYLFSTLLLELQDQTDLITHGDIDAEQFEDELIKIDFARPTACVNDIKRLDASIDFGRRILNTILLYSLNDSQGEGADVSEIVMGTYQTNNRISDIYIQLEQIHGVAWHLHKLNGKYAIRDKRNPNALIRNAASDVSERAAKGEIADMVSELFGPHSYTVGFRPDELSKIPDTNQVKVIIHSEEWTPERVRAVITNDGRGRSWRNTFIFVQPNEGDAIESGTRYIDKARYVEGARQVLADQGLDDGIRARIKNMKEQEEQELRKELRLAYGDVIDGDDLLNEFEMATPMQLDVFVLDEDKDEYSAKTLIDEAAADPFDLESHIWPIAEDLLERKGETTIQAIYEEFLTKPALPIPGGTGDVLDAAKNGGLVDKPILLHTPTDGFSTDLDQLTPQTKLVLEADIDVWEIDDVIDDIRGQFSAGTTELAIGDYYNTLTSKTQVRIEGDEKDLLFMAIGRLTNDDGYVIARGAELLDEPQLDGTVRDVSRATQIGPSAVAERLREAIDDTGEASVEAVLRAIRGDTSVYLPAEDTEQAVTEAVMTLLSEQHLLRTENGYVDSLGDRDVFEMTIVPSVSGAIAAEIDDYIGSLDSDTNFTIDDLHTRFGSSAPEAAIKTYLLQHLGTDSDPAYVIANNGSTDPGQWMPGYPFSTPKSDEELIWEFHYNGGSAADLRDKWNREQDEGSVNHATIEFTLPEDGACRPSSRTRPRWNIRRSSSHLRRTNPRPS